MKRVSKNDNWLKSTIDILKMDEYSGWIKELEQECQHFGCDEMDADGCLWYGVDEWDINIFYTGADLGETPYKYGIDVYSCDLNENGDWETKDHMGTIYVTGDSITKDNMIIKYQKYKENK